VGLWKLSSEDLAGSRHWSNYNSQRSERALDVRMTMRGMPSVRFRFPLRGCPGRVALLRDVSSSFSVSLSLASRSFHARLTVPPLKKPRWRLSCGMPFVPFDLTRQRPSLRLNLISLSAERKANELASLNAERIKLLKRINRVLIDITSCRENSRSTDIN